MMRASFVRQFGSATADTVRFIMHNCAKKTVAFLSDGLTLTGSLSYPKRDKPIPGVLFIHGGGSYTENLYAGWQLYFCQHGYASLSFFCRGVGTSEGAFEKSSLVNRLKDATAAYLFLKNSGVVDPEKICISGSSMGAHIAVRLIEKFPQTKVLILQSAAAYSRVAETLPLNEKFTDDIRKPDSFRKSPVFPILKQYKGAALVVYGENDSVIPDEVKETFRQSIHRGKFRIIKDGAHKLLRPTNELELNARDELYRNSLHFVQRFV